MRFGVLGTGFWARDVHAAALAAHPDAELVGVWGRDLAKAKAVGAEFDVAGYADVDELLAQVDAVAIALPPDVQAPLAERAAAAGKHLLLEKPIALDVADADRVVDAVRRARGWPRSSSSPSASSRGRRPGWSRRPAPQLAGGRGQLAVVPRRLAVRRLALAQASTARCGTSARTRCRCWCPRWGRSSRCRPAQGSGTPCTWCSSTTSGAPAPSPLSHTVAPMAAGTEFFVHGDAGRLVLLPEERRRARRLRGRGGRADRRGVAGGTHPCDVRLRPRRRRRPGRRRAGARHAAAARRSADPLQRVARRLERGPREQVGQQHRRVGLLHVGQPAQPADHPFQVRRRRRRPRAGSRRRRRTR